VIRPSIEQGRYAIKRIVGDVVRVSARIHADGHDLIGAALRVTDPGEADTRTISLKSAGNDQYTGSFIVNSVGRHAYEVEAWIDVFLTWKAEVRRKAEAGLGVPLELRAGAAMVRRVAARAESGIAPALLDWAQALEDAASASPDGVLLVLDDARSSLMPASPLLRTSVTTSHRQPVVVDRPKAGFSSWYELFPRSFGRAEGEHGTFADVERVLPYIAGMGFDVLYLPPIHPIGRSHRKGPNNAESAAVDDVGSPWAIGAEEGGHTAIHPQLGTLDDFHRLLERAREAGLEMALDLAFQCSPDHPWVAQHPEWFRRRIDGSVQYAENPPKKYQDIYPLDFTNPDWQGLWEELERVVLFWIEQGVRIFRVDNPHTKPYPFWEWLISRVKRSHPEVVFLSEAFTRPSVMAQLARLGFSQSYTYFTWRNTAAELRNYFTELTTSELREYFRPNLWPNTPDILPLYLQAGGRPAFLIRLFLAGTLGANYGIYGPAFEHAVAEPIRPGAEEYRDSEKYELKRWNLERPDSLVPWVARLNAIRRENPALQQDHRLRFLNVSHDQAVAFVKTSADGQNHVVVVAGLDPSRGRSVMVDLDPEWVGLERSQAFGATDLLGGGEQIWSGRRHLVDLPAEPAPVRIFRVQGRPRTERDFDYY